MEDKIKEDFKLCGRVCEAIVDEYGTHAPAYEYPEDLRVVSLVWSITGIMEIGGLQSLFQSMFPGDPAYVLTINAFKKSGNLNASKTLQAAVCLFPKCIPPDDDHERIKLLREIPSEVVDRLNSEFWRECDQITVNLAKYIRDNNLDKQ